MWKAGLVAVFTVLQLHIVNSLECYQCKDVAHITDCQSIVQCPTASSCQATFISNKYTLGCRVNAQCSSTNASSSIHTGGSGTLVGRSVTKAVHNGCIQCCQTSNCNRQLCQTNDPSCHDSATIDCAMIAASLDICSDTNHAKKTCRRFCGLCSLVDGNWAPWSSWSACSISCGHGNGTQTRKRSCTDPSSANGGSDCTGMSNQTQACKGPCHDKDGWEFWAAWQSCGVTCGIGLKIRERKCATPYPVGCLGDARETGVCMARACKDGVWSAWGNWGSCSRTDGQGLQKRVRTCTNPPPSLLGKVCTGESVDVQMCLKTPHIANGHWSLWSSWGTCSVTCGIGLRRRDRNCSQPFPSNSGQGCVGDFRDEEICMMNPCQDGGWAAWGNWGSCSRTDGQGLQKRVRTCTNPPPSLLGNVCTGESVDVQMCLNNPHIVNGGWSLWSSSDTCSVTCGIGLRRRNRSCTQPFPSNSGQGCVDGGWTNWSNWGSCSKTCGHGLQKRSRSCTNPLPSNLGKFCSGASSDVKICFQQNCADQGIGFNVVIPSSTGTSQGGMGPALRFTGVITNEGGDYNRNTGLFTCARAGLYSFSLTLTHSLMPGTNFARCHLYKNSQTIAYVSTGPKSATDDALHMASTSMVVHLSPGDVVYPGGCTPVSTMDPLSTFSGFLIEAD